VTIQNRDNKQAVLSRGVVSGLYKIDIHVFSNVLLSGRKSKESPVEMGATEQYFPVDCCVVNAAGL